MIDSIIPHELWKAEGQRQIQQNNLAMLTTNLIFGSYIISAFQVGAKLSQANMSMLPNQNLRST